MFKQLFSIHSFSKLLFHYGLPVLFLFSVIILPGCSKDKGPGSSEYYIRFKANGDQRSINYAVVQGQKFVDSTSVSIGGGKVYVYSFGAANGNAESMMLGVYSDKPLVAPAVFNESTIFKNTLSSTLVVYGNDAASMASGKTFHNIGFFAPVPAYFPETASIKRDFSISFTEYNNTYIKGVFAGTLYRHDGSGNVEAGVKIPITEGEFKIPVN